MDGAGGALSGEGEGNCTETPRGSVAYPEECISANWLAAICRIQSSGGKLRDLSRSSSSVSLGEK